MKRLLPLVLLASCAGPSASQGVQGIVPLIKAERYDEAVANPDLLAPAFVEALRQLNAEGADPNRVVAVADHFWEHYPFSIKDLEISEPDIAAVAEQYFAAASKIHPELPECRRLRDAKEFADLSPSLEALGRDHVDGERCARVVVGWLRRGLEVGPRWIRDEYTYVIPGLISKGAHEVIVDVMNASREPMSRSRLLPLIALLVARWRDRCQEGRWESWNSTLEGLHMPDRWHRLFYSRLARLGALRFPLVLEGWADAGRDLESSRFDPRMRLLGRALAVFAPLADNCSTQDFQKVPEAAERLIAAARGTPFADAARFSWIAADFEARYPGGTDELLSRLVPQFDNPFLASEALVERAGYRFSLIDPPSPARAGELLEWARRLNPPIDAYARATSFLADVLKEEGRETEMIELLERVLRLAPEAKPVYAAELTLSDLQSDARRTLARHYQSKGEWNRALGYWQAFEAGGWCLNGVWTQEEEREMGLAACYERLNRIGEAIPCYWRALEIPEGGEEAARRLLEIHTERKSIEPMKRQVAELVRKLESSPYPPGLKWLMEKLDLK